MTTNNDISTTSNAANLTTDDAATAAKSGIDASSVSADKAINATAQKLSEWNQSAAPKLKQGVDQTKVWIDDKTTKLRDTAQAARDKATDMTDQVVGYTRDEPVKALLIAAAVGAGLMGLLSLMGRSRG